MTAAVQAEGKKSKSPDRTADDDGVGAVLEILAAERRRNELARNHSRQFKPPNPPAEVNAITWRITCGFGRQQFGAQRNIRAFECGYLLHNVAAVSSLVETIAILAQALFATITRLIDRVGP